MPYFTIKDHIKPMPYPLHTKKAPMKRCALFGFLAGLGAALAREQYFVIPCSVDLIQFGL
jgi:hypothetical protein